MKDKDSPFMKQEGEIKRKGEGREFNEKGKRGPNPLKPCKLKKIFSAKGNHAIVQASRR